MQKNAGKERECGDLVIHFTTEFCFESIIICKKLISRTSSQVELLLKHRQLNLVETTKIAGICGTLPSSAALSSSIHHHHYPKSHHEQDQASFETMSNPQAWPFAFWHVVAASSQHCASQLLIDVSAEKCGNLQNTTLTCLDVRQTTFQSTLAPDAIGAC